MAGSPTRELTPDELRRRRARVAKRRREQEIERQRKKKLTIGIGVTSLALLGLGGVFVAARAKSGGEGGVKALVQKASSAIKTRGILGAATALVTKSGAAAAESPVPQDRAAAPLFIFREGPKRAGRTGPGQRMIKHRVALLVPDRLAFRWSLRARKASIFITIRFVATAMAS
jgi:hypothetical protein